jgi:hypothetical protein
VAATIEKVLAKNKTVILKLDPLEQENVRVGDKINLKTSEASSLIGTITEVEGDSATLLVEAADNQPIQVEKGAEVNVAAVGMLPMLSKESNGPIKFTNRPDFQTSLFHSYHTNPAQIYGIDQLQSDFETALISQDNKYKNQSDDYSFASTNRGPILKGSIVFIDPTLGLKFGLKAQRQSIDGRISSSGLENDYDDEAQITLSDIEPLLGKDLFPGLFVGLSYRVHQRQYEGDFYAGSHNINYAVMTPGVVHFTKTYEIGIAFTPTASQKSQLNSNTARTTSGIGLQESSAESETITVREAPRTLVHGRYSLDGTHNIFAALTNHQNRVFNSNENNNGLKNSWSLQAGAEHRLNPTTTVDGALLWDSPSHANGAGVSTETIAKLGFAANYLVNYREGTNLGGGVSYERGAFEWSEGDNTNEVVSDTIFVKVMGTIAL